MQCCRADIKLKLNFCILHLGDMTGEGQTKHYLLLSRHWLQYRQPTTPSKRPPWLGPFPWRVTKKQLQTLPQTNYHPIQPHCDLQPSFSPTADHSVPWECGGPQVLEAHDTAANEEQPEESACTTCVRAVWLQPSFWPGQLRAWADVPHRSRLLWGVSAQQKPSPASQKSSCHGWRELL